MIALDTNVILRFLVKDDEKQYIKVARLLTDLESQKQSAYVPLLVLQEVSWVLSYSYKLDRLRIIEAILSLSTMPMLSLQYANDLKNWLEKAKNNRFDLSDLLIAHHCQTENCLPVMTFDKKATKFELFELLE